MIPVQESLEEYKKELGGMRVQVWFWTKNCWILKTRVKSWTRMIEEAGGDESKKENNLSKNQSVKRGREIMAVTSYVRGVLVEGMQEGCNEMNSSQEVAWGLCAKQPGLLQTVFAMLYGVQRQELMNQVYTRRI